MTLVELNEVFDCLEKAEMQFYQDWKDLKTISDSPDSGYFIMALKERFGIEGEK